MELHFIHAAARKTPGGRWRSRRFSQGEREDPDHGPDQS